MPKSMILGPHVICRLTSAPDKLHEINPDPRKWLCVGDLIAIKETWADMRDAGEPGWPAAYLATWMEDGWGYEPTWLSPATMPLWASRFSVRVEQVIEEEPHRVLVSVLPTPGVGRDPGDIALDDAPLA